MKCQRPFLNLFIRIGPKVRQLASAALGEIMNQSQNENKFAARTTETVFAFKINRKCEKAGGIYAQFPFKSHP